ncbi:monodehydroascorbate reductase [Biscogniauxia marginata]|nr:monodehydroascorbate reductase [Biscogniauxia marginata]
MNVARTFYSQPTAACVLLRSIPKTRTTYFRQFSVSPTKAMPEYKIKGVASLSLQPGDKQEVEVDGIDGAKVLLLNAGGKIQATGPKCTHYGAPLVNGVLTKSGRLTCPWHGACFNGKTGDIENAPALDSLTVFKVVEKDGAVYVQGDEAAIKAGRRKPNFKCSANTAAGAEKLIVVGGGSGAIGTVEGLRENGFTGPITIISNEGYLPIDRPKLSKALLTDPAKAQWRDADWFKTGSVEVVHDEVVDVDLNNKTVTTKSKAKYQYTKLVLATGGSPRNLPLQGFKVLENIFVLRNIHHTKKIVDAIGEKGKKIVVVGSSFIGLEIANAISADNDVTVVGQESVPLERVLGKEVGAGLQKALEGKGIKFQLSASLDKAEPSASNPSQVGAVLLKDGTSLEADLVILGVGVAPATEYLKDNKVIRLEQDGSLKTDENLLVTGVKDVYAIGDIATFPYHGPGGEGKYTRIEHWNVAQNQGRIVAKHIVNPALKAEFFTPIFWSALTGQLRYCGNSANGWDDLVLKGDPAEGKFIGYYCKGDIVVAVVSMGADPVVMKAAELIKLGALPSKAELKGGLDLLQVPFPG